MLRVERDGVCRCDCLILVGQCVWDSLVVVAADGYSPPLLCGENAGQHLYTGLVAGCASVTLHLSSAPHSRAVQILAHQARRAVVSRRSGCPWLVAVSLFICQVDCGAGPPDGCLQWFTGLTGSLFSFNSGGAHLAGQQYSACVRRASGYCTICWAAQTFQLR